MQQLKIEQAGSRLRRGGLRRRREPRCNSSWPVAPGRKSPDAAEGDALYKSLGGPTQGCQPRRSYSSCVLWGTKTSEQVHRWQRMTGVKSECSGWAQK